MGKCFGKRKAWQKKPSVRSFFAFNKILDFGSAKWVNALEKEKLGKRNRPYYVVYLPQNFRFASKARPLGELPR